MPHTKKAIYNRLVLAIILSNLLSIALVINRVAISDSYRYVFLLWNILLAAVPAILAVLLVRRIRQKGWLQTKQILLTIIWLAFLPNSFYMVTDLVHLRQTFEVSLTYDIVMLVSFLINGLIFGYASLILVHKELLRRLSDRQSALLIILVILVSSFAVYLGRFTRWNSWDVVWQPAGLLFDVSDRFVNPGAHVQTFSTTALFFVLLAVIYFVVWQVVRLRFAATDK